MLSPEVATLVSIILCCHIPMQVADKIRAGLDADSLWLVQGEALVEELTSAQKQAADHAAQLATVQQQRAAEQRQLAEAHEALDAALKQLEELSRNAQVRSCSVVCLVPSVFADLERVESLHECFAFTSIAGPLSVQLLGSEHLLAGFFPPMIHEVARRAGTHILLLQIQPACRAGRPGEICANTS